MDFQNFTKIQQKNFEHPSIVRCVTKFEFDRFSRFDFDQLQTKADKSKLYVDRRKGNDDIAKFFSITVK